MPAPPPPKMMERVCENCAHDDDELALVYRVYVTPETWDTPGTVQTLDESELWCASCRSQYPHEPVEEIDETDLG